MLHPKLLIIVSIVVLTTTSCVSSRMSLRKADRLFREKRYDEAAEILKKGLEKEGDGNDQLLFLMDLGLTLHLAGKYEESNKYFLAADKVAEIKDYSNMATEAATLLTSDNIKQYKGEDFEKVLINTYLAMNFLLMGNLESAMVEAKRVNRKLYMMVTKGKRKYKMNAFAHYLSGLIYESEGEFDNAYIDYKKVHRLGETFPGLGRDLWRLAQITDRPDDMERWEREYGLKEADKKEATRLGALRRDAEIIVLYQNGISPIKRPNPQFTQVPKFYARHNPVAHAEVEINGKKRGRTFVLHDIESTAIQNLDDKYSAIVAKKIAGIVAKEVVAHQVEKQTNSPLLGFLTKVAFYASDQADVRSWNLLPKDLQVARFRVKPGEHRVKVLPVGGGASAEKLVRLRKGQRRFIVSRFTP